MNKEIDFRLNKFNTTPNTLRKDPTANDPKTTTTIDLCRLFHHYYLDSYGVTPPNPNHANFEYLRFLSSCRDFRFVNDGPASSKGKKRTISMELGQAFCRYFLYENLGVTYFAHLEKIINKETHPAFEGLTIRKVKNGDIPDYLCCRSVTKPFIAEAKGRYTKIDFSNAEFTKWRAQFNTIQAYDRSKSTIKLKGYIIGTSYATEMSKRVLRSTIYSEDPETPGEEVFNENEPGFGQGTISIHYSRILSKLGLGLMSSALDVGFVIPEDLKFNLPVWRCNFGPIAGERFVGGFISELEPKLVKQSNGRIAFQPNIFRLGIPSPIFIGLRFETFRLLRKVLLGNWKLLSVVEPLVDTEIRPSNIAWLRDGSVTGALDFFEFERIETF